MPIRIGEIEAELAKERLFEDYDDQETGHGAARGGNISVGESDLEDIDQPGAA